MTETEKRGGTKVKLAQKGAARSRFAKKIIDFFKLKIGKDGGPVQNFGDFSVCFKMGKSMLGGNSMKVWYHPGKPFVEKLPTVLEVWWQFDIEQSRLDTFDPDQQWQTKILKLIKPKKVVVQANRSTKKNRTKYVEEMYQQHLRERSLAAQIVQRQCEELLQRCRVRK